MADKARKAQQAMNDLGVGKPQDSRGQSDNTEQGTVTESYVRVTVEAPNDYGPAQVKFKKAVAWVIDDTGFLHLLSLDKETIAVFASRTWKYVELAEES